MCSRFHTTRLQTPSQSLVAPLRHMQCTAEFQFGTYKPYAAHACESGPLTPVQPKQQGANLEAECAALRVQVESLLCRSINYENELQREKDNFYAEFGVLANNLQARIRKAEGDCEAHRACVAELRGEREALVARVSELESDVSSARSGAEASSQRAAELERQLHEAEVNMQVLHSKLELDKNPKQIKHLKEDLIRLEKEKTMMRNEKEAAEEMLHNVTCKLNGAETASRMACKRSDYYEHAVVHLAREVIKNADATRALNAMRVYLDVETQKMQLARIHGKEALHNKTVSFLNAYKSGEITIAVQRTRSASEEKLVAEPTGAHALAIKMLQEIVGHT